MSKGIFYSICFLICLFSCDEDEQMMTGEVNFRFKLVYGEEPLEMFKTYDYPVSGEKFQMTRLSFFISDLTIRSTSGDYNIKDIDYLNLTNSHTVPVAPNGFEYLLKGIQPGNYNSLDFGIGVPAALNAMVPKDFKSGHILSNTSEYWSSWKSYIFFKPEGKISLDGKPISETSFALHLGANEAFRKISLPKPFTVTSGNRTNVDVILDIQKFLNGKTLYNIKGTQQIHSLDQLPLITQLADNLAISFK